MITCQIEWIDEQGNPTPDTNPAIGVATCHSVSFGKEGSRPLFICAEHAARINELELCDWRLHTPAQVSENFHFNLKA